MKLWQCALNITCLFVVSGMFSCSTLPIPSPEPTSTTGSPVTTGTPGKVAVEKLTTTADTILVGIVTSVVSNQGDKVSIYTLVTLSVEQTIKGESAGEALIKVPGGESGGFVLKATDNPSFKTGERVLVFLTKGEGNFTVYGGYQGKFTIDINNMVSDNQSLAEFITQIGNILK